MIVNQFRAWARRAPPSQRADGASALARACLYSSLSPQERAEAIRALTGLLDDPSPLVRRAMAEAFASAADAPHHIVLALAEDQASIAAIVLARTPVLSEAEMIDCAAAADGPVQVAIARRSDLTAPMAAALAEVGTPDALTALSQNLSVTLPLFSLRRMIERCGDTADVREALLARPDLPASVRVDLVAATAQALARFVAGCNWMSNEKIARVAREAKDRAALIIADTFDDRADALSLVTHLRETGQLTSGFLLRAIMSGRVDLFSAALVDLSGMPMVRVQGLVRQFETNGFAALYRKADLPLELLPAFRLALRALAEADREDASGYGLSRSIVTRVLADCGALGDQTLEPVVVLLRRFEAEAARDDARDASLAMDEAQPLTLGSDLRDEPLRLTDLDDLDEGEHQAAPAITTRAPIVWPVSVATDRFEPLLTPQRRAA